MLAGGQSLVPVLAMRLAAPEHLVDINGIGELDTVVADSDGVTVGALARHSRVEHDAPANRVQPLLAQALRLVAHPTIRNRGTTVGSLAHADPAGEMTAVLALCGGSVTAVSSGGRRVIAAADFFLGPLESALRPDELATHAHFPALPRRAGSAFVEIARRNGDYALCGVGAIAELDELGVVRSLRCGYLSVSDTPLVLDLTRGMGGRREQCRRPCPRRRRSAIGSARHCGLPPASGRSVDRSRCPAGDLGCAAGSGRGMTEPEQGESLHEVTLTVNGRSRSATVAARRTLSDFLRHDLGLTGTHVGCEHGVCGACTVLLDDDPVRSCLIFAVSVSGQRVTTVEGLAGEPEDGQPSALSPVQQAFHECHALQCGFCTPGFLTTVTACLAVNPAPTRDEAVEMIAGNLCRCTGYQNIVDAVLRAAELRAAEVQGPQQ